jgi:hypothetical protein
MLGTQLYRVGRHEESLAAAVLCLDATVMFEIHRIRQLPAAARTLTALGRYEEALDIIETDFGPMLDAQHHNLRVHSSTAWSSFFTASTRSNNATASPRPHSSSLPAG